MSTPNAPSVPATTVIGNPRSVFAEQVTIDEATGEKLLIHADSWSALDEIADRLLGDH